MSLKAVKYLRTLYKSRKSKNPSYSMRAFARDCHLPAGRLSEYFQGKRLMTAKIADSIYTKSTLSMTEKKQLVSFFDKESLYDVIPEDTYQHLKNPIVFAILSTFEADDFNGTPSWIAERLGESISEIKKYLNLLERYNFVEKSTEGVFISKLSSAKTLSDIPSQSIRDAHKIRLNKIISNIDNVSIDKRHVTSITLCIAKSKIPLAKKRIDNFLDEMMDLLESTNQEEVYELNIQLFPWKIR